MAIEDRLRRLEGGSSPERLCAEHPCTPVYFTEVLVHPDGTEEYPGGEPPPLCEECPTLTGRAPIRRIEVRHRVGDLDG